MTSSAPTAAARTGARWLVTENGQHSGALDAVKPYIGAVSLSDAYRPNRRLTVNAGARLEYFTFRLAETGGPYPARPFWYAPMPAAQIVGCNAGFVFFENADDLRFGKPRLFHEWSTSRPLTSEFFTYFRGPYRAIRQICSM